MQSGMTLWPIESRITRRLLLGAACASVWPTAAHAAPSGSVVALVGQGFAERSTVRHVLAPKAEVFVGDLIETGAGSRLALRLGRATQLRLGAQARMRIDRFIWDAGGVLELESGAMAFDGPMRRDREITVRSPFGLIAVRGTHFFAGPSNGVFGVFVARGLVRVTGAGKSVDVIAGRGTNIAAPGAAPSDPAIWGQPRIRQAFASVE
jgi:ferric-dicitrate binding protein FerR (iron transport regulator)